MSWWQYALLAYRDATYEQSEPRELDLHLWGATTAYVSTRRLCTTPTSLRDFAGFRKFVSFALLLLVSPSGIQLVVAPIATTIINDCWLSVVPTARRVAMALA
jgi:hypothetical protein